MLLERALDSAQVLTYYIRDKLTVQLYLGGMNKVIPRHVFLTISKPGFAILATMSAVTNYSYLLRVWRVKRDEEFVWLASLEDPHTGKRRGFSSLEDLYVFLSKQVDQAVPEDQSGTQNERRQIVIIRTIKV